ncbi:sensor histidine kinase [Microbacterium sp. RD1]|uniref:sensor histidine kinase n=1 Tax=Microbacterium sp. RD1 TaxID=3457313 RepID=UPI003FA57BA5
MTGAVEAGGEAAAVGAVGPSLGQHPSTRGAGLNRAIRALLLLTIAVNAIYLGALLLPGDPASTLVNIWLSIIAQWVPVGVFWLVAVRTRFARWEVILAAAGITCNAAGDTFYALAMDSSGNLPSPSLADVGYLLYYPLTMAALLVLVRHQSRHSMRPVLFDGGVASLGAAAVLAVILAPVFTDATADASPLNGAIAALYPLFDLLLITAVVGVSASPALRLGPRWQFLVLGFLLFTGADIAYALLSHAGAYTSGTPLDAAWTAGVAFSAIWVDGVTGGEPEPRPAPALTRILPVPALAVLAGLAVLLIATQTPLPPVALVLAAATVALAAVSVLLRQATLTRLLDAQEQLVGQLKRLDKSKSDMIDTMSHEMRTPLTSILGYLDLLLDDDSSLPAERKDMLRVVERNARRLQDLAGNMLVLAGLESGGAAPTMAPIDIGRMLRRVAESLEPFVHSRRVSLRIAAGSGEMLVEGDESQLERAVTNVVENAVKFTPPEGFVRVGAAPAAGSTGRPAVVIDITDTGMGIPADEIPQLFGRFFRATNAQDQAVQGTGLGLAIVREIVQAHGGEISVSSVLGKGTTVRISLPEHSESS